MKNFSQNKDAETITLNVNPKNISFNGFGTVKVSNGNLSARKTLIEFVQYINSVYNLKCIYKTTLLNTVFDFECIADYFNLCETSDFKHTLIEFYYAVYNAEKAA